MVGRVCCYYIFLHHFMSRRRKFLLSRAVEKIGGVKYQPCLPVRTTSEASPEISAKIIVISSPVNKPPPTMKCLNCGSQNVILQSSHAKPKPPNGLLWWLLIGWWLRTLLWLLTKILQLFGHRFDEHDKKHLNSKIFICQNCGYSWSPKSSE